MLERILRFAKRLIPTPLFRLVRLPYHFSLTLLAALIYRFPSKKLRVIGVTGTKGKSSVVELVAAILEAAGYETAVASTIRFKYGSDTEANLFKMTMPGRFFMQRFLRKAVRAGASYAVVEVTSEGIRLFRHRFIDFDAVVFTNLSPEHIESHGSFEAYAATKLKLARALERSSKRPRFMVANLDDAYGKHFLAADIEERLGYRLADAEPYAASSDGVSLTFDGMRLDSKLPGRFSIYNIIAAATLARGLGIERDAIKRGIATLSEIPGRAQEIDAGQDFKVVVDYAHTPESLEAIYQAYDSGRRICVLGGTGGGRDTWKRPKMGAIAASYCHDVILTDEDPYDEDPRAIIDEVAKGMRVKPTIILDRRRAIRNAIEKATPGDIVLITGKGTDPYICGPDGKRTPWSDALVAREELERRLGRKATAPYHRE